MMLKERRHTPPQISYRVIEPARERDREAMATDLRRRARDLSLCGKYKQAARLYEQLLTRTSGDVQSVHRLAELRRRMGDHGGARSAYQLAISLYLDLGWDAKAIAVENALERLGDTPAPRRSHLHAIKRLLLALLMWIAALWSNVREAMADDSKLPSKCPNCGSALVRSPMIPDAARCSSCGVLVESAGDAATDESPTVKTPSKVRPNEGGG